MCEGTTPTTADRVVTYGDVRPEGYGQEGFQRKTSAELLGTINTQYIGCPLGLLNDWEKSYFPLCVATTDETPTFNLIKFKL